MKTPRISLEQWQVLAAVVEQGSFAKAADVLNKSQSAVSYAIARMEQQLPTPALRLEGRKAVLTDAGELLYRRALQLISFANDIEQTAQRLAQGWETQIAIAVESIVPIDPVLKAMQRFGEYAPQTRVMLLETTLSGTDEALLEQRVDMMISPSTPPGFLATPIGDICMLPVAAANHSLAQASTLLSEEDLRQARQIVIRDSGQKRSQDKGWLGAEQRFTVSHVHTMIKALQAGLGFAFAPLPLVNDLLNDGTLKQLNLGTNIERKLPIYLTVAKPDQLGPAGKRFIEELNYCFKPVLQRNGDVHV
ncbi:MAG: LysR family transcriptional regulator [Gammaproteobacteria bacterium]|nr:LysR family transcriptional regulator [Gammaproteobacteria bacterium]MDH5731170.1 LysR family transcriptional regulator [Gammaproteobacteria bacterium]